MGWTPRSRSIILPAKASSVPGAVASVHDLQSEANLKLADNDQRGSTGPCSVAERHTRGIIGMPGSSLIEERKKWSASRIDDFSKGVSALPEVTKHADLCIYVTGSFGRLEASEHSDLDLFFIKRKSQGISEMSRIDKTMMDASLIKKCENMGFPEFSGDGEYLEIHYLEDMLEFLGGRTDDYKNLFTARLLLLLESLPIHNPCLYQEFLCEIAGSYFRDYQDHEADFRPTFLVNDILRFWKTLCLNYEHSRNNLSDNLAETRKSQLKNLKLKFSRMLTCFSLVIPLAAPRPSIGLDDCVSLMQERPLDRLRKVATDYNEDALWDKLAGEYGWFLETTGQNRNDVLNWLGSSSNRSEAIKRAQNFGGAMFGLLNAVVKPETMKYLVI